MARITSSCTEPSPDHCECVGVCWEGCVCGGVWSVPLWWVASFALLWFLISSSVSTAVLVLISHIKVVAHFYCLLLMYQ